MSFFWLIQGKEPNQQFGWHGAGCQVPQTPQILIGITRMGALFEGWSCQFQGSSSLSLLGTSHGRELITIPKLLHPPYQGFFNYNYVDIFFPANLVHIMTKFVTFCLGIVLILIHSQIIFFPLPPQFFSTSTVQSERKIDVVKMSIFP